MFQGDFNVSTFTNGTVSGTAINFSTVTNCQVVGGSIRDPNIILNNASASTGQVIMQTDAGPRWVSPWQSFFMPLSHTVRNINLAFNPSGNINMVEQSLVILTSTSALNYDNVVINTSTAAPGM